MNKFDPIRQVYRINKDEVSGRMIRRLCILDFDEVNYIEEFNEFPDYKHCVWISMDSGVHGVYEMDLREAFDLFRRSRDFMNRIDFLSN